VNVIAVIVGIILAVMCLGSSLADFKKNPQIVETLTQLGVSPERMSLLGIVKLVGVAGLIVGFWVTVIGVIAGVGLALYFVIAIGFHVRAKDNVKNTFPAFLLFVLAILYTLTTLAK
jgi:uncharacterized membrane protein YphA (DoxX/SURF4 family)